MNLHGRYVQLLDYVDESPWRELIAGHGFWRETASFERAQVDHAYFTLMKYNVMIHESSDANPLSKFGAAVPREFSDLAQTRHLCMQWAQVHTTLFGPGHLAKLGLFVFPPGSASHYHVDGNVFRAGQVVDLADPKEWDIIAFNQAARRTILPLQVNAEDEFLIMGRKIRITPGLFFEFSNGLPHAFFNRGNEHTVLLVSSYIADADRYKPHLADL